jgi:hypothetical protein
MRYPQYALGLLTGFCLASLYFMAPAILDSFKQPEEPPVASKSKFEVVDTYMGCDIIKRENKSVFESQYFMDCRK